MLDCAICFHNRDDFYQQAYVAVLSCFVNTKTPIRLHMVVNDDSASFLPYFQALCEEYGHELIVYPPPPIPDDIRALFHELGRYTDASLYRLCFHEFIDADRLVYFDCDIVFERDVADLATTDLSHAFAAAAHDPERRWSPGKTRKYIQRLGINVNRYFNSGVLYLNLKNIREASAANGNIFWEQYRKLALVWKSLSYDIFDQDLLNIFLSNDKERLVLLDASFNYELCLFDRRFLPLEALQGKILHYAALKFWMKFFPAHLAYWKYHAMSPWKGSTFERISQRIQDPADKWMNLVLDVWKKPTRYRWLKRLLP